MKTAISSVLFLAIGILSFLLLKQCNSSNEAAEELARLQRNALAMSDTLKIIKSDNGRMVVEKSSLELKVSELNDEQKKLVKRLEFANAKKPEIIIQTEIVYRDTGIKVETAVDKTSDTSGKFKFVYNPTLPGKNKFSIDGSIPYILRKSNQGKYDVFADGQSELSVTQTIDVVAGLYTDPQTKLLKVRLSTDFPGITFAGVNGIKITDNAEARKAIRDARKNFGIGFNLGYGMLFTPGGYQPGPYFGLGVHYSPKILQF
jgi:hypothetical protein